jgi:hypothetical protein
MALPNLIEISDEGGEEAEQEQVDSEEESSEAELGKLSMKNLNANTFIE